MFNKTGLQCCSNSGGLKFCKSFISKLYCKVGLNMQFKIACVAMHVFFCDESLSHVTF